jgi:hypothetical protein
MSTEELGVIEAFLESTYFPGGSPSASWLAGGFVKTAEIITHSQSGYPNLC